MSKTKMGSISREPSNIALFRYDDEALPIVDQEAKHQLRLFVVEFSCLEPRPSRLLDVVARDSTRYRGTDMAEV